MIGKVLVGSLASVELRRNSQGRPHMCTSFHMTSASSRFCYILLLLALALKLARRRMEDPDQFREAAAFLLPACACQLFAALCIFCHALCALQSDNVEGLPFILCSEVAKASTSRPTANGMRHGMSSGRSRLQRTRPRRTTAIAKRKQPALRQRLI